jgi:hypothetical protein
MSICNSDKTDETKYEFFIMGSSDYSCCKNGIEYYISVKNYTLINPEGTPVVISNYFIDYDNDDDDNDTRNLCLFATIIWEDIQYINDDPDPYNYDPDPSMVIYRDDLPKVTEEIYLTMINQLCEQYYEPTTHFKHFNPKLPKIKLSEFSDEKYQYIKCAFEKLIAKFTRNDK